MILTIQRRKEWIYNFLFYYVVKFLYNYTRWHKNCGQRRTKFFFSKRRIFSKTATVTILKPSPMDSSRKTILESVITPKTKFFSPNTNSGTAWVVGQAGTRNRIIDFLGRSNNLIFMGPTVQSERCDFCVKSMKLSWTASAKEKSLFRTIKETLKRDRQTIFSQRTLNHATERVAKAFI